MTPRRNLKTAQELGMETIRQDLPFFPGEQSQRLIR
jgi:hypothetical protein